VMDREVNPELPVTLSLKNVTAEDALNKVFASVDYFYTIKDNMLYIKATDTKIYELGHPAIIQTYSTDLGGDILGSAMSGKSGGGSQLKGAITQKTESDKSAYNFWEVIEKSIEKTLVTPGEASASAQQTFTVNRLTGTIIVTARKKNLEKVENYINTIKKVINRQVIVEAKIIEVALSDSLQFGINWNSVITYGAGRSGNIGTTNFASVVPSTAPYFIASTAAATDFTALLNAIQVQGETRILSNPRVNIMNGQTALLGVGRNTSFISKIETTQQAVAGAAPTITFTVDTGSVLSGIMIGIVPYISETGEISLSVTPIVSNLVKLDSQGLGQTDAAGNRPYLVQLPQIDLRQMSTTVKVRSGQMVVIGGLISKTEGLTDSQVPGLGDIPILGYFFKSRDKVVKKTELVVLLQPVIVSR
jgi:MSHA type pilus biogenesis protein MshL